MEMRVRDEGGATVVGILGELDAASSPVLSQRLDELLGEGRRRLVIDLQGVPFIDSSGLSTLVRVFKHVRSGGGSLGLAAMQPAVRRVFELTRLDRSFDIHADVADAVRRGSR
jgi:anti-sigma B factor antagonist